VLELSGEETGVMCWHKWTKWEQYEQPMIYFKMPTVKSFTKMQKRHCEKCGYEQRKEVGEY